MELERPKTTSNKRTRDNEIPPENSNSLILNDKLYEFPKVPSEEPKVYVSSPSLQGIKTEKETEKAYIKPQLEKHMQPEQEEFKWQEGGLKTLLEQQKVEMKIPFVTPIYPALMQERVNQVEPVPPQEAENIFVIPSEVQEALKSFQVEFTAVEEPTVWKIITN
jgi:hypothetical protein